jgi:hypothetical protein
LEIVQERTTLGSIWTSRAFAWASTVTIELTIFISAIKDPIVWVGIQYALLLAPPIILVIAIRGNSYAAVFSRLITAFVAVTTLDLLYIR